MKTIKRKLLSVVLALVLCIGLLPMSAFAEDSITVSTQDALNEAIKNASGATVINLESGTYTLPSFSDKEITFIGSSEVVFNVSSAVQPQRCTLTFEGVTVTFPNNANYVGLQHTTKVVYKNCTINGQQTMYAPTVVFEDCTLVNNTNNYCVWTYGATDVTFTGCTFNTAGKAILIYTEGETHATITVSDCTFNDTGDNDLKKAAIEIGSSPHSADTTYNVITSNCTVNGFAVNDEGTNMGSTLVGNKNGMDIEHLSVKVDNVSQSCKISGEHGTAEDIPAVAPTCTQTGLTAGSKCSVCGEVLTEQTVIATTEHTVVVDEAVEPTYTSTGLTEGSHCSVCEEVFVAQEVIPKLVDTDNADVINPKTGDNSNMALWLGLMFISVCALVVLMITNRKHNSVR